MLYTLIGNGNANKKEVISTLNSLRDAAEDFWMALVDPSEELSEANKAVTEWVNKRKIPFEYVSSNEGDSFPDWVSDAEYVHLVKNPTAFTVKLTRVRPQEGEDRAVLVLSDDLDNDEVLLSAIEKFIDVGIPVYDLGGQMVEITLEEVPEDEVISQPLETPTAEDFQIKGDTPSDDDIEFTREDLMELNVTELKAMVQSLGVVPRDMRSKDSMIDALMGDASVTLEEVASATLVQEPVQEYDTKSSTPVGRFYLVKINADGKAEMRLLTAKQAALVY